jgi:NADH-quinone oxidoreductase subunit L
VLAELLAILLLPLAAFVIQIAVGRRLPRHGDFISIGAIFAAFVLAAKLFATTIMGGGGDVLPFVREIDYLRLGSFHISMGLLVDQLTVCMLVVVTLVSSMVHLFSVGYMHGDPRYTRFFAYLSLFSFSMLGLILAHNLIALYIFWELVGLTSYLLIGFWFEKHSAANAAKKAFLTTRVGDLGMFIGILIIAWKIGDFAYADVFAGIARGELAGPLLTVAGIGLFLGAVGKSAQVPLHVWLPDAMEGPTPVSALIHAATMVAAGVYLVGRLYPVFNLEAFWIIALVGSITAFIAATIAIAATDIKKVLAYSTISQLGYMIAGLGTGAFAAGLFHLWTHAFFKALLFLGAGSVIHAVHTQELPEMGGLKRKMPITFATMLIATLAISGVPGLSGFFSKDAILAGSLAFGMAYGGLRYLPFVLLIISAGITAFYMFRLLFLTFAGSPHDHHRYEHAHESPTVMTIPLIVLAFMTVFSVGIPFVTDRWFEHQVKMPVLADYAPGAEAGAHHESGTGHGAEAPAAGEAHGIPAAHGLATAEHPEGEPAPGHGPFAITHAHEHAAHSPAMMGSILVAGLGILIAYLTYVRGVISAGAWAERLRPLYGLIKNKYYFDEIYAVVPVRLTLLCAGFCRLFDIYIVDALVNGAAKLGVRISTIAGAIDNFGVDGLVNGIAQTVIGFGRAARKVQTGRIQHYVYGFMGILLLIVFGKMLR